MTAAEKQHRFLILVAFGLVYAFWGSTYLAIKVAVENIPPLVMAGVRFLIAGPLMLAWCAFNGRRIRLTGRDLRHLVIIGLLLLSGGNVLLAWSEQYLPSGLASLIVAVVPIWVAVIEGFILRKARLTGRGWAGLVLGILGLAVLLWPKLNGTSSVLEMELIACGVVLLGSLSWTCGSLASKYLDLSIGPFAATGWEMTFAGLFNSGLALMLGQQHRTVWSMKGFGAILYLVVFGSWVGFTAYVWLLEHVPTPKVATYAYVNPVVAVLLGWMVLGETIDAYIGAGAVIIVAAVALVTSSKLKARPGLATQRLPATEPGSD